MLGEEDIGMALHATRVVPLAIPSAHGPLGLEQLAHAVAQLANAPLVSDDCRVRRPIALSTTAWTQLEQLAQATTDAQARPISASDVATVIIEQYLAATGAALS